MAVTPEALWSMEVQALGNLSPSTGLFSTQLQIKQQIQLTSAKDSKKMSPRHRSELSDRGLKAKAALRPGIHVGLEDSLNLT